MATKNRDITIGGYKISKEIPLLTVPEHEPFKTYLSLLENQVALIGVKHGQRIATTEEKQIIKNSAELAFQFDPALEHKVWCKITMFGVAPDVESNKLKIEKKTYKAVEQIAETQNWQKSWLNVWLVIEDEAKVTTDPLLQAIASDFKTKYSNLIDLNENTRILTNVDPEQIVLPETSLADAIAKASAEQKRISLKAEVRNISDSTIPETSEKKDCIMFLENATPQLPNRKLLNISAYAGRT